MTLSRAAVSSNIQTVLSKAGQTSSLMSAALNPSSFNNQRNKLLMLAAPNQAYSSKNSNPQLKHKLNQLVDGLFSKDNLIFKSLFCQQKKLSNNSKV